MAIIFGQPQCCICQQMIEEGEEWTATWGVVFVPPHPLYAFCDAPLHFSCLETWPHRKEFARGYFEMFRQMPLDGAGYILAEGQSWFLGCGPSTKGRKPHYIEIVLADWPIRLRSNDWTGWEAFATSGFKRNLSSAALVETGRAMEQVRACVETQGDLDALFDAAQAQRGKLKP